MSKPCPAILTYNCQKPPHESLAWMSIFHAYSQGSEPKTIKHSPLPIRFYARTDKEARAKASLWWKEEQDKEELKKEMARKAAEFMSALARRKRVRIGK